MKTVKTEVEMYLPGDHLSASFLLRGARAPKFAVTCAEKLAVTLCLPCPDVLVIRSIRVLCDPPPDQLLEFDLRVGSDGVLVAGARQSEPVLVLAKPYRLEFNVYARMFFRLAGARHGSVHVTPSLIGTLEQPGL